MSREKDLAKKNALRIKRKKKELEDQFLVQLKSQKYQFSNLTNT